MKQINNLPLFRTVAFQKPVFPVQDKLTIHQPVNNLTIGCPDVIPTAAPVGHSNRATGVHRTCYRQKHRNVKDYPRPRVSVACTLAIKKARTVMVLSNFCWFSKVQNLPSVESELCMFMQAMTLVFHGLLAGFFVAMVCSFLVGTFVPLG